MAKRSKTKECVCIHEKIYRKARRNNPSDRIIDDAPLTHLWKHIVYDAIEYALDVKKVK